MTIKQSLALGLGALALAACQPATDSGDQGATMDSATQSAVSTNFTVDVSYHTLDNGLRVVLSEDHTVPTATVAVYYGVGFRNEPRGRTGFAHLFEHLMFQGSRNLPHGAFDTLIYGSGGVNNGSTRYDFTNYFEVVPSNALEAIIWAEADRMGQPNLDESQLDNQREVVRNEPRGRTGFAHLFEHLMFQGSRNLPHGAFDTLIYGSGGVNNGSTRYDFTNYFEVIPSNALEAIIWAEADRMGQPNLDESQLDNQREVVRNEVFVNVINQPYGGWIWIDLPMVANENWHNAHNFYGDLTDLDAASLEDAQAFFDQFYAPNNAVMVVAGDIDKDETLGWIEQYFSYIEAGDPLPEIDTSEPRQEEEKFDYIEDNLANQPALAVGYHMPERGTPEYYAMILIDQLLVQGDDSRLTQSLVAEEGYASGVFGGINLLGNAFNYSGPMLWTVGLIHDSEFTVSEVMGTMDTTIEGIRTTPVTEAELERARTKLLSDFYGTVDTSTRFGLVDLLASFAMFDGDPSRINRITEGFEQVTPELVMSTAQEYLRPTNRTVLEVRLAGDDSQ